MVNERQLFGAENFLPVPCLLYEKIIKNGAANFFGHYIGQLFNVAIYYGVKPWLCPAGIVAYLVNGGATANALVHINHVAGYAVANAADQSTGFAVGIAQAVFCGF